jgi:transmembrane sensor
MSSLKSIEDQAAAWLARRDSGEWYASDERELTQWLDAATAHRITFLRLERIWEEAGRLQVLSAGRAPTATASSEQWAESPFFQARARKERGHSFPEEKSARRRLALRAPRRILAVAATVLLAVGVGTYLTRGTPGGEHFTTPVGGTASVPLADGSNITLNTATEVRVELSQKERHVNLEKGEAFFVVAKDAKRPFVVVAGNKRVIAVGTQFSVRREGDGVDVVVTEGTVRIEANRSGAEMHPSLPENAALNAGGSSADATGAAVLLAAGTIARARDGDVLVEEHSLPGAEEALSWRLGYLTFHETTLAEAVEEFNRYNRHKMRIGDPAVAAIRISGTFRPTNYEAFVRLLQDGFSIHAVDSSESTALTLK